MQTSRHLHKSEHTHTAATALGESKGGSSLDKVDNLQIYSRTLGPDMLPLLRLVYGHFTSTMPWGLAEDGSCTLASVEVHNHPRFGSTKQKGLYVHVFSCIAIFAVSHPLSIGFGKTIIGWDYK